MANENKVLACVDQSSYANAVADYAAWAAMRLGAPLEFLHVLDRHPKLESAADHSGAIGINAQEHLLTELSAEDEARTRAGREVGRVFLNRLRERALAAGAAQVDTRLRHGDVEDTLAEQQEGARLLVLGRRGASSETKQGHLGGHLEWVVRSLDRPVLAVIGEYIPPTRVLLAFDGSNVMRRGVEMLARSPLLKGLPIQVLMAGKAQAQGPGQVDWARQTLQDAGLDVTSEIIEGDPKAVLPHAVKSRNIDLLVMGAYSHSPLRSLFFGSKTSVLLQSAGVTTLLLR